MILPKKVKIGAHEYKVIYPYVFRERGDIRGQCAEAELEIRIRDNDAGGVKMAETVQMVTFLHELVHGIGSAFLAADEKHIDEIVVEGLAQGLAAVIIDNPELFVDLSKREEAKNEMDKEKT